MIYQIKNKHSADCGTPPIIGNDCDFFQYYENQHGEQFVFVGFRNDKLGENCETAHFYSGELGWEKAELSRQMMVPTHGTLNTDEHRWMTMCWASLLYEKYQDVFDRYSEQQKVYFRGIMIEMLTERCPQKTQKQIEQEVDENLKRMYR